MSRPRVGAGLPRPQNDQRGAILILVLLILVAVVALCLTLARDVKIEVTVASARADEVRLKALVDSAVDMALAELRQETDPGDSLFSTWRDDEARFAGVELGGGRFWLLCTEPDPGDGVELRYGLRDEASKLDVNVASRDQLLALPGITEDAVDGILDWRDDDDDTSEFGAESDYYGALDPAYEAKNGPIESLEELLRVREIDEAMLYGEDRNRNGLLDPGEDDADGSFPPDDADGVLDRGLIDYLTVFSRDFNRTIDNRLRLVWNDVSEEDIAQALTAAGVTDPLLGRVRQIKRQTPEIQALGQLVQQIGGTADPVGMALVLDEIATSAEPLPGRINVNTAPRELLAGLPGMTEDDVEAILTMRVDPSLDLSSPAWLLSVLPPNRFAALVDLVTTRSDQFTVHAVAILDDRPRRFKRIEVLVDRTFVPVRVLMWRDLTGLGFPLPEERGEDQP